MDDAKILRCNPQGQAERTTRLALAYGTVAGVYPSVRTGNFIADFAALATTSHFFDHEEIFRLVYIGSSRFSLE